MARGRSRCPECGTRTSWQRLQEHGSKCPNCDFDMGLATFRKQLRDGRFSFNNDRLDRMYSICKTHKISGFDLISIAIDSKLTAWEHCPEKVKQDQMLQKLSR